MRTERGAALVLLLLCVSACLPDGAPASAPARRSTPVQAVPAGGMRPADDIARPRPTSVVQDISPVRAPVMLPAGSGHGRRVVYSISQQRVWAVDGSGAVRRTYLVSGRTSQPGAGTFRVYSRSRHAASAVSAETMEYMVRFTHGRRTGAPIGFHSIPVDRSGHAVQSTARLGEPLSAGCVRQRRSDAAFLWTFAPVGTSVVVVA